MGVADEDALEIAARSVVGDVVDEEGVVGVGAGEPVFGLAGAGVVSGEGGEAAGVRGGAALKAPR
ncbi:MAG: hypothetical protein OXG26_20135 [Caldilineaceae bacterium]|nr:hypothetical protein [Caldilineaceae bacterium]